MVRRAKEQVVRELNAIDRLDRKVLEILRDYPRATLGEMAEQAGVSRTTFKTRLDRLWEQGIIIGHETQLDLAAMGFGVQALVLLRVKQGEMERVRNLLSETPYVIEAFAITGDFDVQCRVVARDTVELQEILLRLGETDEITATNSSVILSSLVMHRKVQALNLLPL